MDFTKHSRGPTVTASLRSTLHGVSWCNEDRVLSSFFFFFLQDQRHELVLKVRALIRELVSGGLLLRDPTRLLDHVVTGAVQTLVCLKVCNLMAPKSRACLLDYQKVHVSLHKS